MAKEKTSDIKSGTAGQRKAAAKARRQQQKKQQTTILIGVIVVVVVVAVAVIAYINQPVEIDMPAAFGDYTAVPVSVTEQGYFRLGDPDAPVQMEEFSNFRCVHCGELHKTLKGRLIDSYIKDGTLSVVYVPLVNDSVSMLGAQAALCAGQQDPIKFWEMHDVLFSWLDAGFTFGQGHVSAAAERLGLDTGAFGACLGNEAVRNVLQAAIDEANLRGVEGTPAIFFNGERPTCGGGDSKCEGNLPYELIAQNIEQRLAGR